MKTNIILVANRKGGVGKTTTILNVGTCLLAKGYKVLYMDLDPQASLTKLFDIETELDNNHFVKGSYELLQDNIKNINDYIVETEEGINVIPGRNELSLLKPGVTTLRDVIDKNLKGLYDFILIDTCPYINELFMNCLYASDYTIIPSKCDLVNRDGLLETFKAIDTLEMVFKNAKLKRKVNIGGVLFTMYKENINVEKAFYKIMTKDVKERGYKVFKAYIHNSSKVQESFINSTGVYAYAKKNKASIDYMSITEEIEKDLK